MDDKIIQLINIKGYSIVSDKEKGYIHVEPIPTEEELKNIYEYEYYQKEKTSYIDNTLKDLDWWNTIYQDKYETFEANIAKSHKSILDIGCGSGYFLDFGQRRGWSCMGIEPSLGAYNHAKRFGYELINSVFSKDLLENKKFDVIHMNQVLEHVPNPELLLLELKNFLNKEGIVCITVPNEFSTLQNLLHEKEDFPQWWLSPPHHLNYFSVESLSKVIEKLGLEIILKESSFPLEMFLLMGENYIKNPNLGRTIHQKRKDFDLKISKYKNKEKRKFYQLLADLGRGRTITIYAKKVD